MPLQLTHIKYELVGCELVANKSSIFTGLDTKHVRIISRFMRTISSSVIYWPRDFCLQMETTNSCCKLKGSGIQYHGSRIVAFINEKAFLKDFHLNCLLVSN